MAQGELKSGPVWVLLNMHHVGQRPSWCLRNQTPRLDEGMESAEGGEEKAGAFKVPGPPAGSLPSKQEVGRPPRRPLEFCDIDPIHTLLEVL